MAKSGKSAAASTVGRPKGVSVGRSAPGNFTFTSARNGSGATQTTANVGRAPQAFKKAGKKTNYPQPASVKK